jgi:hypothetical protein
MVTDPLLSKVNSPGPCAACKRRGVYIFYVTAQVRLDSFRQTTVQNFLDSGF